MLTVLSTAKHTQLLLYVLAAAAGSMIGAFLRDLVFRKRGEEGLKRPRWKRQTEGDAAPRPPLLVLVFVARAVQFLLVVWAAIYFGCRIA